MVDILPPSMFSAFPPGPLGTTAEIGRLAASGLCGGQGGVTSTQELKHGSSQPPAWLRNTHTGSIELPTPPADMKDPSFNPLAGVNGLSSYYKGVQMVPPNPNAQPQDTSVVSRMKYMSKAPPPTDSRRSSTHDATAASAHTVSHPPSQKDENIANYLQIPSSITEVSGNLAELAAKITCLFWFESTSTLRQIERNLGAPEPNPTLVSEAFPTMSFQKWAATTLATTQVSKSVIILALLFIFRLKERNPSVKGKVGSEYRLLTVALMLGNKYLDDNTYTNKTWAEVSGISVKEVHVMEVEFLSNMRYTLYVDSADWKAWEVKLGRFWSAIQRAQHYVPSSLPRIPQFNTNPFSGSKLPTPPTSMQGSPPYLADHSGLPPTYPRPTNNPPYLAPPYPSPAPTIPDFDPRPTGRKRSSEDTTDEPVSKRIVTNLPPSASLQPTLTPCSGNALTSNIPMLPMPPATVQGQRSSLSMPPSATSSYPLPSTRPTQFNGTFDHRTQTPSRPILPQLALSNQQIQDRPILQPRTRAATPSPTSYEFPSSHYSTPHNLSPDVSSAHAYSHSPYKPIRMVDTLLYPPPSASLHNISQNIPRDNIRYYSLQAGKRAPERVGTLPYHHQDSLAPGQFPQPQPLYH